MRQLKIQKAITSRNNEALDRYLTDKLEIPVWVSETALTNVVTGCLKVLETPTALRQTLMRSR